MARDLTAHVCQHADGRRFLGINHPKKRDELAWLEVGQTGSIVADVESATYVLMGRIPKMTFRQVQFVEAPIFTLDDLVRPNEFARWLRARVLP